LCKILIKPIALLKTAFFRKRLAKNFFVSDIFSKKGGEKISHCFFWKNPKKFVKKTENFFYVYLVFVSRYLERICFPNPKGINFC